MSKPIAIGQNIRAVRTERGMTQHDVYIATGISTSQLSSYENGKQMIGLVTLAKIATALNTSIDRLYFGTPSEAFLNETEDFGETVINCFKKLHELGVVNSVNVGMEPGHADVCKCAFELKKMFELLREYEARKEFFPDGDAYLAQIYKSIANEIHHRYDEDGNRVVKAPLS